VVWNSKHTMYWSTLLLLASTSNIYRFAVPIRPESEQTRVSKIIDSIIERVMKTIIPIWTRSKIYYIQLKVDWCSFQKCNIFLLKFVPARRKVIICKGIAELHSGYKKVMVKLHLFLKQEVSLYLI